jgi:hypothetical protein
MEKLSIEETTVATVSILDVTYLQEEFGGPTEQFVRLEVGDWPIGDVPLIHWYSINRGNGNLELISGPISGILEQFYITNETTGEEK